MTPHRKKDRKVQPTGQTREVKIQIDEEILASMAFLPTAFAATGSIPSQLERFALMILNALQKRAETISIRKTAQPVPKLGQPGSKDGN